jgi:hypothetical protein
MPAQSASSPTPVRSRSRQAGWSSVMRKPPARACVAQRHRPMMLEQYERGSRIARDLLDHIPGLRALTCWYSRSACFPEVLERVGRSRRPPSQANPSVASTSDPLKSRPRGRRPAIAPSGAGTGLGRPPQPSIPLSRRKAKSAAKALTRGLTVLAARAVAPPTSPRTCATYATRTPPRNHRLRRCVGTAYTRELGSPPHCHGCGRGVLLREGPDGRGHGRGFRRGALIDSRDGQFG